MEKPEAFLKRMPEATDGDKSKDGDADKPKDGDKAKEPDKAVELPEGDRPVEKAEGYKDFTLPEGLTVDPKRVDEFKAWGAKHRLSQNAMQEALALEGEVAKQVVASQYQAFYDTRKAWIEQIRADPEIGGKNFDLSRVLFTKGLKAAADGDAKFEAAVEQALDHTGAGDNPHIVRLITRLMRAIAPVEGDHVGGDGGAPAATKSRAEVLYPNMTKA